jgi:hypothetical protein
MTSSTSASSTCPLNPLAVRRSVIRLFNIRTTSATRASFSRMAFVNVSVKVCSMLMSRAQAPARERLP